MVADSLHDEGVNDAIDQTAEGAALLGDHCEAVGVSGSRAHRTDQGALCDPEGVVADGLDDEHHDEQCAGYALRETEVCKQQRERDADDDAADDRPGAEFAGFEGELFNDGTSQEHRDNVAPDGERIHDGGDLRAEL